VHLNQCVYLYIYLITYVFSNYRSPMSQSRHAELARRQARHTHMGGSLLHRAALALLP
jgi:hypothetical protein